MNTWRKLIVNYRSISWILLVALLLLTIFPVTYHLHNENHHIAGNELISHYHTVDFHTVMDIVELEHFDDGVQQAHAGAPDSIVKKVSAQFFTIVFLAVVLSLIPYANYRVERQSDYSHIGHILNPLFLSPPLRAPPL